MEENTPYCKAYEDPVFMNREDLRSSRMHLELLRAKLILDEQNIKSTVSVFGSARFKSRLEAESELEGLEISKALITNEEKETKAELNKRINKVRTDLKNSKYYEMARYFSQLMSEYSLKTNNEEFVVMTGGGPGIMEAANRGAAEAGSKSIGLSIKLPFEQSSNEFITPELDILFNYFSARKMHFLTRAKALVAFPGGFGTMDELWEILTMIQTNKSENIPVVLAGKQFWDKAINLQFLAEQGVISPDDLDLVYVSDSPKKMVEHIIDFYK